MGKEHFLILRYLVLLLGAIEQSPSSNAILNAKIRRREITLKESLKLNMDRSPLLYFPVMVGWDMSVTNSSKDCAVSLRKKGLKMQPPLPLLLEPRSRLLYYDLLLYALEERDIDTTNGVLMKQTLNLRNISLGSSLCSVLVCIIVQFYIVYLQLCSTIFYYIIFSGSC